MVGKVCPLKVDLADTRFQLYTDFAEPLGLFESQLTILHASDHRDAQMVTDIWNALLLKGLSVSIGSWLTTHPD
jgi:hypothetical protein